MSDVDWADRAAAEIVNGFRRDWISTDVAAYLREHARPAREADAVRNSAMDACYSVYCGGDAKVFYDKESDLRRAMFAYDAATRGKGGGG